MRKLLTLLLCCGLSTHAADVEFSSKATISSIDNADFLHAITAAGLTRRLEASLFNAKVANSTTLTIAGTANEITSSAGAQDLSANRTWTISLPTGIDLGGKTSLEIPNAAAPTVNVFGQIAGDNNLWASGRGAVLFYDGTAVTALLGVLASDTPTDGQLAKYNSATGTLTWEDDSTGSGGDSASINATAVSDSFSLTNTAASSTVASTTWSVSAQSNPDPDLVSVAIGAASATAAGIVTAGTQSFGGAKTFNDAVVANGGTFSNTLAVVGTGDAVVDLAGGTKGSTSFQAPTSGETNLFKLDLANPALGDNLHIHSKVTAGGTNITTFTNKPTLNATTATVADITTTNNIKYLSAELAVQSNVTNYTADFTFATRAKLLTNNFHISAVSSVPTDGVKTWTAVLRNFSGATHVVSLDPSIPRNGTNHVAVANAKKAIVTLMADASGGSTITNLVGSITLFDSP